MYFREQTLQRGGCGAGAGGLVGNQLLFSYCVRSGFFSIIIQLSQRTYMYFY